jgi:UDP-2-acetamido-3-amino-2,3-dideoxy-glucuronate N-acetyltransferase
MHDSKTARSADTSISTGIIGVAGAIIHPSATIEDDVAIGSGTRVWHQAQIRCGARIGQDCTIGKDVYIDAGVRIGNRVKIQNGVSVYHGVTLEDDTFVGPHASFTNDEMPRAFSEDWRVTPTVVRLGASIGANATIVCGVILGPFSMVAAGSTVTTDVMPHGLVIGSPARHVAYICRRGHRMRATTSLDYRTIYECASCRERLAISYGVESVLGDRRTGTERRCKSR